MQNKIKSTHSFKFQKTLAYFGYTFLLVGKSQSQELNVCLARCKSLGSFKLGTGYGRPEFTSAINLTH